MKEYIKNIFMGIYTVLVGMKITFLHLFEKNVTVQYPNVHPLQQASTDKMSANNRNRLMLHFDACNGCNSCARICPVKCITVETFKVVPDDPDDPKLSDGTKRKLWVPVYDIDFAKCCFCGLCTTVCPTEAIVTTTEFEYSVYDRKELLYHFTIMTPEQIEQKKKLLDEFNKKQKAEKAAAAAKKAAEEKAKAAENKSEEKA